MTNVVILTTFERKPGSLYVESDDDRGRVRRVVRTYLRLENGTDDNLIGDFAYDQVNLLSDDVIQAAIERGKTMDMLKVCNEILAEIAA